VQIASMKDSQEWWAFLRGFLLEHVVEIQPIHQQGGIAMVFWDPDKEWTDGLDQMGWKGETVWRMPARLRRAMETVDSVTKRWVRRKKGPGRIFLVNGKGSMLINVSKSEGVYIEPGSMDHELADELGRDPGTKIILDDRKMWGFKA